MTTVGDLISELIQHEPALARVLAEHRADNDDILPHVFFGDLTRWVVAHAPAQDVLQVLERHMIHGDHDVTNLITVSFLENLCDAPDTSVRAGLGPHLRAQLTEMEG